MGTFVYSGYVEKYYICGLKVGVRIICGYALYMGIYGNWGDLTLVLAGFMSGEGS